MRLSRIKAVILAAVIALLSISVLVAGTFALFSDKTETNVHLQAATLDAKLYRTSVTGKRVDGNGVIVGYEDKTVVDLEQDGAALFDFSNVLPGVEQEVTLKIENHGTAAFDYFVSIVNVQATSDADKALLSQISITFTPNGGQAVEFSLGEYIEKGQNVKFGTLTSGETATSAEFKIKATFVDGGEIDNSAMGGKVVFDVSVEALQAAQ